MMDQEARIFLEEQHRQILQLVGQNDFLEVITPQRFPSQEFWLSMLVRGLACCEGQIQFAHGLNFRIRLNDDYLIRADSREILEYLGPHEEPWHPNIHGRGIFAPISPGQGLVEIVRMCFNIWTWNQYYEQDSERNQQVLDWARSQPAGRFPVEGRTLTWCHTCCAAPICPSL